MGKIKYLVGKCMATCIATCCTTTLEYFLLLPKTAPHGVVLEKGNRQKRDILNGTDGGRRSAQGSDISVVNGTFRRLELKHFQCNVLPFAFVIGVSSPQKTFIRRQLFFILQRVSKIQ